MGAANEVAFTCDSRRLLGAGSDKRLLVWNTLTGQVHARVCVCTHVVCAVMAVVVCLVLCMHTNMYRHSCDK